MTAHFCESISILSAFPATQKNVKIAINGKILDAFCARRLIPYPFFIQLADNLGLEQKVGVEMLQRLWIIVLNGN